jgi:F-type H+-transporting ATPase subunit a
MSYLNLDTINFDTMSLNLNASPLLLNTEIISPLDQFEIRDLISLDAAVLANLHLSVTNIGLYLTLSFFILLTVSLAGNNYENLVSNR